MNICLAAGISSQDVLWSVITGFQEQLQAQQDLTAEATAAVQELRQDVERLKADRNALLLRQMGTQTLNKAVRYCVPSVVHPFAARHASVDSISQYNDHIAARLQYIRNTYPRLTVGVNALKEAAFLVAHPAAMEDAAGNVVNPSIELLRELVAKEFEGTVVEGPVQEVLGCLRDMQQRLGEDLFVSTSRP